MLNMKILTRKRSIVGIPRALFYWKQPLFWEEFFKNLGFEVVLSPKTNKEIVEKGVKISDPETCYSVKVFFGHLLFLKDKVDFIFIPRLKTNSEKLEYCPKFFGIPDVAKISIKKTILTVTIDERKEKTNKTLEKFSKKLIENKENLDIKKVIEKAFKKTEERRKEEEKKFFEKIKSKKKKIILVSHPYNLYDEYVNMEMERKIKKMGGEVIFIEEIPPTKLLDPTPKFHWEFGKEIMEKISTILSHNINGVIEISAFQCGCDAVLKEFVEEKFKEQKIPFLYLMIDEQTGEAGVQTRLEAFWDTLH